MTRDEIRAVLQRFKQDYAEACGIVERGVFGSMARNEHHNGSDVDVCVTTKTPNPFLLVHIMDALEELTCK
jgi:predicted nucleotidyltransferase